MRGLDYYTHTVFEWLTTELGSQGAVCSGGRYDGLVTQLGGEPTPGGRLGAGRGAHRRAIARSAGRDAGRRAPDVYFVIAGARAEAEGLALAERIRDALPCDAHREPIAAAAASNRS